MKMSYLILATLLMLLGCEPSYAFLPFIGGKGMAATLSTKQVATADYIPSVVSSTTTSSIMTRKAKFSRDTFAGLERVVFPGFAVTPTINNYLGAELTPANNITYNGWIEYPIGTYTQILCSGSATCVAPAGGILLSDPIGVNIPTNTEYMVWFYEPSGQVILYSAGYSIVDGFLNVSDSCGSYCEATNMGTSGVPSTPGTITDNQNGEIGITSAATVQPTSIKSAYFLGDSRTAGAHGTANLSLNLGNLAPSVGSSMAYINGGVGGLRGSTFYYSHTNQLALAKYTTNVVDELGINDFYQFGNSPSAIVLAYKEKLAYLFSQNNLPYVWTTIEPVTTTTDSCATLINQTPESFNTNRVTFNDTIRAGGLGVSSYFEIANPVESNSSGTLTQDGGYWYAATQYSNDCLHEIAAGTAAIAASGNITVSGITSSTIPTTSNPAATLSLTSSTFSGGALTAGYGTTTAGVVPGAPPITIGAQVKYAGTPAGAGWAISTGPASIGVSSSNCFMALRSGNGTITTSTSTSLCDGNTHWIAVTIVPTSTTSTTYTMYVDGVTPTGGTYSVNMPVGNYNAALFPLAIRTRSDQLGSYEWPGSVANAAIFVGAITAVPSTFPFVGTETGLIDAWPLSTNGSATIGPNG